MGLLIACDFAARLWISGNRVRMLTSPFGLIAIVVTLSLLAPIVGEGLAFLRIARSLRLLHPYLLLHRLRQDFGWFRRNEQTVLATLNLGAFIFLMTAIVHETQQGSNRNIFNYADALYFTVTARTTTGFGYIVPAGA